MTPSLLSWMGDADALRHLDQFAVKEIPLALGYQRTRKDDLYIALVGELFDRMRDGAALPSDWARLGNALAQYGAADRAAEIRSVGISQAEATLFSSAAFYFGGFSASAYVTMRSLGRPLNGYGGRACFDLLAKPSDVVSPLVHELRSALIRGDYAAIAGVEAQIVNSTKEALRVGPDEWIPLRLLQTFLARFRETNLRAVLPEGHSDFWTPLVSSLVGRGNWDFFPSQIEAIQRGLLLRTDTFSLQMPTGAGKTTLCETLLFYHLSARPDSAAVLLVPYRSLASELRGTLVRHLNAMGISARCAYGGTVPSGDEVRAYDDTRALIATPETLSGVLSANTAFARRISLVICDEGHRLDTPSRGVGLELLLARMKNREGGPQRYVFVSAIVPNIEEINSWLGGSDDGVVRSDYRPALAEFAVLRGLGQGATAALDLEMHPHEAAPIRYRIERFLRREDFRWINPSTKRPNTYQFSSKKTRAVASARKALPMGAAVVFAANKRGNQGAIGLAEELLQQIQKALPLPNPIQFADVGAVELTSAYLENEFGSDWVGTRALRAGAVLHHGDIPQETREVVERLLRDRMVSFAICTSTLAEGVNLPIRTLVLYSVQRVGAGGARVNLLTRDIKNLVGRAGRAGATTKGLVICANEDQWPLVESVAQQAAGEPVVGALRTLMEHLRNQLVAINTAPTNDLLERSPVVHSLVDGIDATLVELVAEEIGEPELIRMASELADQTFASRQAGEASKQLLRDVFTLRAQRVFALKASGRIEWVRETGTRVRMVDVVESSLLQMRPTWDDVVDPIDPSLINTFLEWAWTQPELLQTVREAYRVESDTDLGTLREGFFSTVQLWLSGATFLQIAAGAGRSVDELLGVHSQVLTFALQTMVEQAIAVLEKVLESQGRELCAAVRHFPEHLRFGVPSTAGCTLAAGGITHRRAFVEIGRILTPAIVRADDRAQVFDLAQQSLEAHHDQWRTRLGTLVYRRTMQDLSYVTGRRSGEE